MRPSGRLHLGHLWGALDNWKRLQKEYECFYFVADWHALTTEYADTGALRENVEEMVIDWLAAGLDAEGSTLFVQSWVPEHAELNLLFMMLVPVPWLERVPTYKEQREALREKDLSTIGFLNYPLLQAADILIYKADCVPVGVDQQPHIEFTREVARRFNNFYGRVFPEPEALLTETPKLPGTDGRKMSKSYGNCIFLADTPEEVARKAKMMFTDPARKYRHDPGHPDTCPVFYYHGLYSGEEKQREIAPACRTAQIGCTDCKALLAEKLARAQEEYYERRRKIAAAKEGIWELLRAGSVRAREVAQATLAEVRQAMGLPGW